MVEQEFKDTEIQLDEAENSEKVEESNHQIILTPEEIEALFEEKAKHKMSKGQKTTTWRNKRHRGCQKA